MSDKISKILIGIIKTVSSLLCILPRSVALKIGKLIGMVAYILSIRKEVAKKNISIAFSDSNNQYREKILFDCYIHYGMMLTDFIRQQSIDKNNLDDYFTLNKKYREILLNAKGGCIMSAHLGNWEFILPFMGLNGFPMDTVIKKQTNHDINQLYIKKRTFKNIKLIWKKNALRELYKALENQRFIGLASDQNARSKGIKINFFNKKSSFPKGAGIFYNRTGCEIYMVLCLMGSDYKYHVFVEEIKVDKSNLSEEEVVFKVNEKYSKLLESKIRQFPSQYFWFHKKWNKNIYR